MPDKGDVLDFHFQKRLSHPKIVISGKDIDDSKKEYLDIMQDHKSAHFVMSLGGGNRKIASPSDSSIAPKLEHVQEI